MKHFKVKVTKDYLVFCAGHFITYGDHLCEALHGHNYRAGVVLEGSLDEHCCVFDFVTLKHMMKEFVDELDHRVLLPLENPLLQISEHDDHITTIYKNKRYTFPREDVVLLPLPNTTAEMLACHLAAKVKGRLADVTNITAIEVEVEEATGQAAFYRETV